MDTEPTADSSSPSVYDPNHLVDTLLERLHLKNDAALCRALRINRPVISKIRHRKVPVAASLLIRMHEESDLSLEYLRDLLGDRRQKFRISPQHFKPKSKRKTPNDATE